MLCNMVTCIFTDQVPVAFSLTKLRKNKQFAKSENRVPKSPKTIHKLDHIEGCQSGKVGRQVPKKYSAMCKPFIL